MEPAKAENYIDEMPRGDAFSSKEAVNRLLIADGLAADRAGARRKQEEMSDAELAEYLRGKSAEEIIGVYRSAGFGMLRNPDMFADGYVLPPATDVQEIFSNTDNYNAVPVILGTNRDEVKLFQMMSDEMVSKVFGVPYAVRDEARYERNSRYRSDLWKVRAVDRLATIMRRAQGPTVFAYRFDADELRNLAIIDLKELLGAAHALEIPFVFGNFEGVFDFIYPGSFKNQRDLLSNAMMSYWAEFAREGAPGRGRFDEWPKWTPWENGSPAADRIMIFDLENDGGIRMSPARLTTADIKLRFLTDESFATQEAYCAAYRQYFDGEDFVESEYRNLGDEGC